MIDVTRITRQAVKGVPFLQKDLARRLPDAPSPGPALRKAIERTATCSSAISSSSPRACVSLAWPRHGISSSGP